MIAVCDVKIWMKCVHTLRTGRHKRQADITFLFQYIYNFRLKFFVSSWMISILVVCIKNLQFINHSHDLLYEDLEYHHTWAWGTFVIRISIKFGVRVWSLFLSHNLIVGEANIQYQLIGNILSKRCNRDEMTESMIVDKFSADLTDTTCKCSGGSIDIRKF